MLSEEEVAKIERVQMILKIVIEKTVLMKAKVEAIISIENASIHPKKALLDIANEVLAMLGDEQVDMPENLG